MVTLESIRSDLEARLAIDKEIHSVVVIADTLDEALEDAAVQLNSHVNNLECEVIEKGSHGILGLMKKPWQIRAYENAEILAKKQAQKNNDMFASQDEFQEEKIVDRDGIFYIRHFGSSIYLKVLNPEGKGHAVKESEILANAKRSDTESLDNDEIKKAAKNGTNGQYVEIGTYKHMPAGDALMTVDISRDEMHATITVTAPSMSGSDVSPEAIKRALQTQGVVAGIDEKKIQDFVDNPVFNIPYEVASAVLPVDGKDAYIAYNFETDRSKLKMKEAENGQVNFKELNLIQNVVEGQPLATKMLPERGKGGKTLFGRYLEAKNGKDIPIPLGRNVKLDSDGRTIIAAVNGQVLLIGDKISVEPIYEVDNVDIKSGNIDFNGTVICHGSVEDGFSVKASGNIEVHGNVGNCTLTADGDIIISSGVRGREEGVINSGKSVWARFIEQTTVHAEDSVIVQDSIVNSQITAMKKIVLIGKRATIMGGHLFATEEITAKNIGSNGGGAETILEVGYDPKAKQRLLEIQDEQIKLLRELEEIELNITTLEDQKKLRRSLSLEKQESLQSFKEQRDAISAHNDDIVKEIQDIQSRLRELKVVGKVNASGTVYAGVKILIRDEKHEVRADQKSVTYYFENGFVHTGKYAPNASVDKIKDPDGYTTH